MTAARATPEEPVRQALRRHLVDDLGVPPPCLRLELGLSPWDPQVRDRVDLVAFDATRGEAVPVLLAECKAPGIPLDGKVISQLRRYLRLLPARWAVATNGRQILSWRCGDDGWEALPLPRWEEMKR